MESEWKGDELFLGARVSPRAIADGDAGAPGKPGKPVGWHSRGYLPHFESGAVIQMVTYRLADSLPRAVAARLAHELDAEEGDTAYRKRIEAWLDAGHGSCWLREPEIARVVLDSWRHFDGERYHLRAWVVMPNHVHLLVKMIQPYVLQDAVKGWKSFTAREINKLLGRKGEVWQREYWDRYVRDENHYVQAVHYIHQNPVKAGLTSRAEDWPWSTAREIASPGARVSPRANRR